MNNDKNFNLLAIYDQIFELATQKDKRTNLQSPFQNHLLFKLL